MKDLIGVIRGMVADGVVEKSKYHEYLSELEQNLVLLLDMSGYQYEDDRSPLFRLSSEQRLAIVEEKEREFSKNQHLGVCEGLNYWNSVFDDFMKVYHLGWCRTFTLNSNGYIDVEIYCSLNPSFSGEKRESGKINFINEMNRLKSMGFDLTFDSTKGKLLNTENNHNIIFNMFHEKGAKMISIQTTEKELEDIKFIIHPKHLKNFLVDKETVLLEVSDTLNADEKAELNKTLSDLLMAVFNLKGELLNTCGYIVESYFARLCETLNFECELRTMVKKRHEDARNKNTLIREKEMSIGESIDLEEIHKAMPKINKLIEGYFLNHMSFQLLDLKANKYGTIGFDLRYLSTDYSFSSAKLLCEEELKKTFETVGECKKNENLFIKDTPANRNKMMEIIRGIPSAFIKNVISEYRNEEFIINKIELAINNVADIFKLKIEEDSEE